MIVVEDVGLVSRVVMGAVAAPQQRAEKGEYDDYQQHRKDRSLIASLVRNIYNGAKKRLCNYLY